MKREAGPILFGDDDRQGPGTRCSSPISRTGASPGAKLTASTGRTRDRLPVRGFTTLLDNHLTLILNTVGLARNRRVGTFEASAKSAAVQQWALELPGVGAAVAGGTAGGMQTGIQVQSGNGPEKPQRFQHLAAIHRR